jgi:WD40 repeat protein
VDLKSDQHFEIPHGGEYALAFSPVDPYLAMGGMGDSTVYLYNDDGDFIASLVGHRANIEDVEFSPDGRLLASGSADRTIRIWDTDTRTQVAILRGHTHMVKALKFIGDGQRLISSGTDRQVCVWNPHQQDNWPVTVANAVPDYRFRYSRASFSPDGEYLATRNRDDSVSLRSTTKLEEVRRIQALGTSNRGVRFSPRQSFLAAGDANGYLMLLDPDKPHEMTSVAIAPGAEISPVGYSRDGGRLLVRAHNATQTFCIICSVPDLVELNRWPIPKDDRYAAFSPDGEFVVTGHLDQTTRIWKVDDPWQPIRQRPNSSVDGIAFSPAGDMLAIASRTGEAEIWNRASFSRTRPIAGHMQRVGAIAFSPDGTRLATGGGASDPVKLWDLATRRELITLFVEGSYFGHVEFSPDGDAILAIDASGALHLWRVPTFDEIRALERSGARTWLQRPE